MRLSTSIGEFAGDLERAAHDGAELPSGSLRQLASVMREWQTRALRLELSQRARHAPTRRQGELSLIGGTDVHPAGGRR